MRVASTTAGGVPRLLAELPTRLTPTPVARMALPHAAASRPAARRSSGSSGPPSPRSSSCTRSGRPSASVQTWLDAATTVAPRFRRVAAPVAAAAGTPARAVLDVGRSGAEATLLQAGRIVARRSSGVGGDRLDLAVRALCPGRRRPTPDGCARPSRCSRRRVMGPYGSRPEQVRAALAPLLDEAVAALAEVVAAAREPVPVLLTGGRGALSAAGRTRRRRGIRRRRAGGPAPRPRRRCSARLTLRPAATRPRR